MENQQIIVNNIIGKADDNGYIRVTLGYNLFNLIRGARPIDANNKPVPFEESKDDELREKNRLFVINGVNIHSNYNFDTKKTIYIMQEKDAQQYHIPVSQQQSAQINNLPSSPFSLSYFRTQGEPETVDAKQTA